MKYFADALKINQVGLILCVTINPSCTIFVFSQTLTSLDLQENGMGIEGIRYLTDTLKINQVTHSQYTIRSVESF